MLKIPMVDLARGAQALGPELNEAMREVAESGAYVLGPGVTALEEEVAEYLGTSHAVGVASGTDALHLALAGLEIGCGAEVITTPFTFAATVEAIEYVDGKTVLVDIDPETYNIDPALIEAAITEHTQAIMPVHMFGQPADMDAVMAIADKHDLRVIEDCAQSFGASIGGKMAGGIGDAGALSFYPTKTLGGFGDGGMIAVKDEQVDARIRELRNHGIGAGGEHVRLGYNSRLDELQAAMLRLKFRNIDAMNERRAEIAAHYNSVLGSTSATVPSARDGLKHVYGYYTLLVDDRDGLRKALGDAGIGTAIYYARAVHENRYFARTCRHGELPVAERVASRCVSLPIFPEMTDDEVDYVASTTAALLS